ncbi:hypothetical protein ACFFLM_08030 [Deinococcus oregonensis]|uniref:Uncharacterized protein n=1 Tax=Deinococcus oregonensis TaxID=1805970 RepID=A0ABV6B0G4_9DEIO
MHGTLYTLGRLELAGVAVQRLPLLVLTWLVLEGPTERRRLRELFWPEADAAAAHSRVTFSKLRAALPHLALTGELLSATLPCDALILRKAPSLAHYSGAFLSTVRLEGLSAELQDWILEQREQLAELVQLRLIVEVEQSASPAQAHALAEQAVQVLGAPPLAPDLLVRLQAAALPGTSLEAQLRRERAALEGPLRVTPPAALVGRERELAQVLACAACEESSSLHLAAPSGMGKSTLALSAVREWQALGRPALYVALDHLPSSAALTAHLTRLLCPAAGTHLHGEAELLQALSARPLFLVLDGTDHLPDLPATLAGWQKTVPALRMVTAGRGPWPDTWPHLLLRGLQVPALQEPGPMLLQVPAVQLLMRAAGLRGVLPQDHLHALAMIARRVQGVPLALRLVGQWLQHRPLSEVVQLLLQGQGAPPDLTALLQPILRRSWFDRSPDEQHQLMRLAQFPDWHRDDLQRLAGLSAAQIQPLIQHGLLLEQGERVQVLPLLTAWLQTLQGYDAALAERHATWHLSQLRERPPLDPQLVAEQTNVLQALKWRARQGQGEPELITRLAQQFERLGLCADGEVALTEVEREMTCEAQQAALRVHRAWLAFRDGRTRDAEGLARSVLACVPAAPTPTLQRAWMQAHNVLAVVHGHRGEAAQAIAALSQAVQWAQTLGDLERQAVYLSNLALQQKNLGLYPQALATLQAVSPEHCPQGRKELVWGTALRILQVRLDDPSTLPQELLSRAQDLAATVEQAQLPQLRGLTLLVAARAALIVGQPDLALNHLAQIRRQLQRSPDLTLLAGTELLCARAHYQQFNTPVARRALRAAAALCVQRQDEAGLLETLLVLCEDLFDSAPHCARQLAVVVATYPTSSAAQRRQAAVWVSPGEARPQGALSHWVQSALEQLEGAAPRAFGSPLHGPP